MTNERADFLSSSLLSLTASFALLGFALSGCDGKDGSATETPGDDASVEAKAEGGDGEADNLCTKYTSCSACISGQQSEGKTEGEAETQCGLAVAGCWVTWDKPVVCGDETYDEKPE
ncbi:prolyl-tRNA synthetase [Plesiocystis pacifica SIR-1]|uniref:Prolyl-tRNA synthetase n=1 Tax=Plesiocystis pacifica SIR-1 TaxID=391625 RepID=A6G1U9_9BACT|nr:hypothetical protein [Plesiocystis pacifica]EDM80139.1 prolyl-tRNA synthetase [Plesiocystis pacifica SIR-1]